MSGTFFERRKAAQEALAKQKELLQQHRALLDTYEAEYAGMKESNTCSAEAFLRKHTQIMEQTQKCESIEVNIRDIQRMLDTELHLRPAS